MMRTQPLISIIMCFLNEERFIREAIQSVLHQEYTNWELLMIDDGSTDGSSETAKSFALAYPGKIIYQDHEGHANRGTSISRNLALKIASGELVTFLDGDDVWLPNLLSHLLKTIHEQRVDIVIEASKYWYTWSSTGQKDVIIPVGVPQDRLYQPYELILRLYPLGKGMAPCICAMLMSTSILRKYGGYDENFNGMYEDQTLLTKLYLQEPIYISSGCHNWYRQNAGSLVDSSHTSGRYFHERKRYLEWLEEYLQNINVSSLRLRYLLYKAWMPYRYPVQHYFFMAVPQKIRSAGKKMLKKATSF